MNYFRTFLIIFFFTQGFSQENSASLLNRPREYTGVEEKEKVDFISVGILAPENGKNRAADDMVRGLQLAVEEWVQVSGFWFQKDKKNKRIEDASSNQHSAFNIQHSFESGGKEMPITLLRSEFDDPWQGGTHEIIDLVVNKKVRALVAFGDELTHMALLVAARLRIPVVSIATEENLTMTGLPWIFRLPPSNHQQAAVIASAMKEKGLKTGILYTKGFDERKTAEKIKFQLGKMHQPAAFFLNVLSPDISNDEISMVYNSGVQSLILSMDYNNAEKWIEYFRQNTTVPDIVLPWIPGLEFPENGSRVNMLRPFTQTQQWTEFENIYQKKYKTSPSCSAAYGYDAMKVLIRAIEYNGIDRPSIRDSIAALSGYKGATGIITWDNGGGNVSDCKFEFESESESEFEKNSHH